jgi:hypothetical protein
VIPHQQQLSPVTNCIRNSAFPDAQPQEPILIKPGAVTLGLGPQAEPSGLSDRVQPDRNGIVRAQNLEVFRCLEIENAFLAAVYAIVPCRSR